MMKQLLTFVACAMTTLPVLAGPIKPAQVSQQANWYVHADLDTLRTTTIGETLMAAIEDEHGRQLKAVKRMFSLNPLTDLHGITLYGNGEKDQGVVLIHGTFDREHLEDLIGASEDYKTSEHHGETVHTWTDKKKTQHGAIVGRDLVVISERKALVSHALDVLHERKPAMDGSPFGAAPSAILLGVANLENIEIKGEEAQLLEKAKALQVRFFESEERLNSELVINTANEEDAEQIRKVLDGMIALGELANEDLAKLGIESEVSVSDQRDVTARVSAPSRNLLELVDQAGKLSKFMN